MKNQAMESAATVQLLDGRLASLRRLSADDAEAVAALHQHLTDCDRLFRFFTLRPMHLEELVSRLTEPADGQYALGAFDAERLIGVANYVVYNDLYNDPSSAEVAIAVAHEDHLCGVGTALLTNLAQIARSRSAAIRSRHYGRESAHVHRLVGFGLAFYATERGLSSSSGDRAARGA
jgi:hypothetical protein